jgi:hypothetical protein
MIAKINSTRMEEHPTVPMTTDLLQRLKELAALQGCSVAELLRRSAETYLKNYYDRQEAKAS